MEHHTYKRNFIKSVIFRLDFPVPIPTLSALQMPTNFQKNISEYFPIIEQTKTLKQEVQMSPEGVVGKQKEGIIYNFRNSDRTCQIGLESSFLFIEHTNYLGYEDFSRLVDLTIDNFFSNWPDTPINRLGLRYQNDINIPTNNGVLDWSQYISHSLLSPLGVYGDGEKLNRFIVQTELKTNEYFGRIIAGIPNPDYPSPIRKRQFIIDIDLYINEAVDKQSIKPKMDLYHDAILNFFETSIIQPLRDYMDHADA